MQTKSKSPVHTPNDGKPTSIPIANIIVGPRLRLLNEDSVNSLSDSMSAVGLKTPIAVRRVNDSWALVVGLHRLRAAQRLGWLEISAVIMAGDETDARVWEISENLHRAELTALERAGHLSEWVRLVSEKAKVTQLVSPSGLQPLEQGIRKAARELGVSQPEVQRAVKIASLTPEAKAAAVDAGLDDNQSALLIAAKENPERQVAKVAEIVQKKKIRRRRASVASRQRRKAAEAGSEPLQNGWQEKIEAAVRTIASLLIEHVPKMSLTSLIENLQAVGQNAHIGEIEKCMRKLRPELFGLDRETESGAAAGEAHSAEIAPSRL
jgi:ParB-like chromosome segregation protein Spo0J